MSLRCLVSDRMVPGIILLLLLFLTACAGNSERGSGGTAAYEALMEETPDRDDILMIHGDNFSAQVFNDALVLDLDANATTGYTWMITEEPDNFVSDYNVSIESDNKNQIVGAGGISEFHIIARKEGTGTMVFQYKRPWEGGETAGTYALTLTISGNQSGLQIDEVSFVQID